MTSLERVDQSTYLPSLPNGTRTERTSPERPLVEWAAEADAAYSLAQRMHGTSFCPAQFRGKPEEAAVAILAGAEVGLSPLAALRSFDVISGTAAPRALTLRAVAQRHGCQFLTVSESETKVVMRARRRGQTDWEEVVWTIERAQRLGLSNKDNWRKQPMAMLVARATADLARRVAADAILGIGYSVEELDDDNTATAATRTVQRATARRAKPPAAPVDEPPLDGEVVDEDAPDPITDAQMKKLHAVFGECEIRDRDERLAYAHDVLGREIATSSELTKFEASQVIDALEALAATRRSAAVEEPVDAEIVEDPPLDGDA